MRLTTDFHDYYDWAFDGNGCELVRFAKDSGPDKKEQFQILKNAGFKIPPVGTLDELFDLGWWEEGRIKYVVAYEDLMSHRGNGKDLWSIGKWKTNPHMSGIRRHDDKWKTFCSAFVLGSPDLNRSISWRRLQVGPHVFWIEYTSADDWRSNRGEGDIELLESRLNDGFHPVLKYPLFAIDFVHGVKDMYAIDLNIAPGVRGTGVERELCAIDFVRALESSFA